MVEDIVSTGIKVSEVDIWTISTGRCSDLLASTFSRKIIMRENLYEIIPFAKQFSINKLGVVKGPEGIKKHYRNADGYPTVGIKLDSGTFTTMGVHRLLAIVFLNPPINYETLHVNHIDSNKDNFSLDNLEWVSPKENNVHASLSNKSKKQKIITINYSGFMKLHSNLEDASNYLNCSTSDVWVSLKNGTKLNDHEVKFRGKYLPKDLKKETHYKINTSRKLKVLDTDTDEVTYYDSVNECSRALNCAPSGVQQRISYLNDIKLLKGRWIIADVDLEFPDLDKLDFKIKSGNKDVVAFNLNEKKLCVYSSAKDFWFSNNLSKKAVTTTLRRDVLREINGWVFCYLINKNAERLGLYVKCPDLHL